MASTEMPSKDSPDLHLVVATPEENLAQLHVNSDEWKGNLSLEAYLRREEFLVQQELTKNGGLTAWMLVHQPAGSEKRQVLCGCESIKKKALLAHDGTVEEAVAHGVASVFCPKQYRGKGYAGRMMTELGKKLKSWKVEDGKSNAFSVLYSDIGKDFYAARGWQPFPSAHITIPATSIPGKTAIGPIRALHKEDASDLCTLDEKFIRTRLEKRTSSTLDEKFIRTRLQKRTSSPSTKPAVALLPDSRTLAWHWAREDFVSTENNNNTRPAFMDLGRGAITELDGRWKGKKVWIWWTRVWTNSAENTPNTLHILRLGVEDENYEETDPANEDDAFVIRGRAHPQAVARLLAQAQKVAKESGMDEVQIWNPTSTTLAAARTVYSDARVVQREKESIASLRWYGEGDWRSVEWVCNEKFGWC